MNKIVNGNTGAEVITNIRSQFNITGTTDFNIQQFDKKWNDWIDIMPEELTDRQKLRILPAEVHVPIVVESTDVLSAIESIAGSSKVPYEVLSSVEVSSPAEGLSTSAEASIPDVASPSIDDQGSGDKATSLQR